MQANSNIFVATGFWDCVYELGSAAAPVLQTDLDAWGRLSYWAKQSGSGQIILVLYTEGGEELTVPAHAYATDLVVVFRDASTRARAAFDAKYPFSTLFNTQSTADPRPDLTGDGITLV